MLDYMPFHYTITLQRRNAYDDFGIPVATADETYACHIRSNDSLVPITDKDGSVFVISFYVTVRGTCNATAGDTIIFGNNRYQIKTRTWIRDYDGNVIATKYGVNN